MNNPLMELKNKRKLLLAAHRGCAGVNVPCNSLSAYKAALHYDADIVELDVERSADGKLFIQHPGLEPIHLGFYDSIKNHPADFVEQMHLFNADRTPTLDPILRFEEALDFLKGKCIINIDKFWNNPEAIAKSVRERNMQDQVLVKTSIKDQQIDDLETYAYDLPYMPMVREVDDCLERFANRNIRYVGSEAIFKTEESELCSPEYLEKMHDAGKLVWANAIVYNYKSVLSAGHTDDISAIGEPEKGWGWLADHGYDIIQTDWLPACDAWLKQTSRRI